MNKNYLIFKLLVATFFLASLYACGGGGGSSSPAGSTTTANKYGTTSTRGDYAEWTLSGSSLNATWQVIDNSGQVDYIFTIAANCAAANTFNVRNCTITTSSCVDGVSACPTAPTGSLELMDAGGVALYVNTDSGTVDEQLHIGFAKDNDACATDLTGDYTFIRTGLGKDENFGSYRSDAQFLSILHSDFGFDTADANVTSQSVAYRTGSESETLGDLGCTSGVRSRIIGGVGSLRLMATSSGLFVLDLPAGQGGQLSFKVGNAASLADFAGKTFTGISFPDNSNPDTLRAVFGAVSSNKVDFTASFASGATQNLSIMDLGTADSMTGPTYPNFTATTVAGYNDPGTTLDDTYPSPDAIPGLFKLDGLGDSGRVIMAAMISAGKVIGVGMVYNWRTTLDVDPSAGDGVTTFLADGLYNTGNFIIFEQ